MNGRYLLDTNIIVALFAGDSSVSNRISKEIVFLPVVAVGELYYGASKSSRVAENSSRLDGFVASNVIIDSDPGTARIYGRIKASLAAKGRPIPENDIWIAAQAIQHDLTLATRDAHFSNVAGLRVESW